MLPFRNLNLHPAPPARGWRTERVEWMAEQQPQGWHREDIKGALRKKHRSLEALSKAWGFHPSAISVALNPGSYWPHLEARIAEEIGTTPHALWPDLWTPDGTRRPPSIAADDSPARRPAHRQIGKAA